MSLEMVGLPTESEVTENQDGSVSVTHPDAPEPVTVSAELVEQTTGNNAPAPEIEQTVQVDEVLNALMGAIAPAHLATQHLKMFLYGANGCGKTVFSAQAPGPLLADCDKEGAISLLNFPTLKATKVLPVRSIFAVEKLVGYLKAGVKEFDWVETLIIDPFDDLVYRALSEQVRGNPTVGVKDTERQNMYLAEGYDYNVVTERFHQMMDEIKSLDRHVILTAHVQEREDKGTGLTVIRSNITPKLATIIGGAVSLVGYMQYNAADQKRLIYTAPTATITAKTRLALPPVIENPNFNMILDAFNKIKNEVTN